MNVAVVNTGPGVTCPTATESRSCASVSQPSRCTSSDRKNARSTYPLPYKTEPHAAGTRTGAVQRGVSVRPGRRGPRREISRPAAHVHALLMARLDGQALAALRARAQGSAPEIPASRGRGPGVPVRTADSLPTQRMRGLGPRGTSAAASNVRPTGSRRSKGVVSRHLVDADLTCAALTFLAAPADRLPAEGRVGRAATAEHHIAKPSRNSFRPGQTGKTFSSGEPDSAEATPSNSGVRSIGGTPVPGEPASTARASSARPCARTVHARPIPHA
jgi:hypothetical protein